jgi:hypothetical protein
MTLLASTAVAGPAGTVTHLSGTISAKRVDGSTKLLSIASEIHEGDELSTQRDTYARIRFADGGEVVMRPETELKIASYAFEEAKPASDNVVLGLIRGGLRAITGMIGKRNRDAYKVRTTTATIGIRGTHFGALLCSDNCAGIPTVSGQQPENGLHVDVANGAIIVTNSAGEQIFNAGQFGYVRDNQTIPVFRPPNQGIRVTMPQAISQNNAGGSGIGSGDQTQCTVQ